MGLLKAAKRKRKLDGFRASVAVLPSNSSSTAVFYKPTKKKQTQNEPSQQGFCYHFFINHATESFWFILSHRLPALLASCGAARKANGARKSLRNQTAVFWWVWQKFKAVAASWKPDFYSLPRREEKMEKSFFLCSTPATTRSYTVGGKHFPYFPPRWSWAGARRVLFATAHRNSAVSRGSHW